MMKDKWTIKETRVEQWETAYTVVELKITGTEKNGLIQKLCDEVSNGRAELAKVNARLEVAETALRTALGGLNAPHGYAKTVITEALAKLREME